MKALPIENLLMISWFYLILHLYFIILASIYQVLIISACDIAYNPLSRDDRLET